MHKNQTIRLMKQQILRQKNTIKGLKERLSSSQSAQQMSGDAAANLKVKYLLKIKEVISKNCNILLIIYNLKTI